MSTPPWVPGEGAMDPDLALQNIRRDAATISERWLQAVAQTSYVGAGPQELRDQFRALTDQVLAALASPVAVEGEARAVGTKLVQLGFTGPNALGNTLHALGEELLARLPEAARPLVTKVSAGIGAGFAAAARDGLLGEQEAIRAAQLGERMRLLGAVRESEARLAAAQRIAHLGSFDWDLQSPIVSLSDEMYRLFGWQPGEVVTNLEGWFTSVHPDDLHLVKQSVEDAFAGKFYPFEFRTAGRDGVVRTLSARYEVVSDSTGRPIRIFGTCLDITELKRSEEARREAEAEAAALRRLDNLKDELLSTISHELRTPLAVVHGYAQRLAMRARTLSPEALQATIKSIESSSAQLTLLVEDLLDFSRMQRGDVQVQIEEFDLVPKLQELLTGIRQRPGGERVTSELPAGLPVHGDPARVHQIVINLVDNALKYAPEGPVVLRGRRVHKSPAAEATDTAGTAARVEVVDSGPGIPLKEQPRVWEKFYRGSTVAGVSRARGSGIGLAVVRALVEAQGGRVGLESASGQGATFWFELPAAGADPSSA